MDYGVPLADFGEQDGNNNYGSVDSIGDRTGVKNDSSSSAGKLFVGGVGWETSEETFTRYFSKYGEVTDSVIMMDKITGRSRGFGFVTFADQEIADNVIQQSHVIDGRAVEIKRTFPREDTQARGVSKTKKIFVGGLPVSLSEDEMREYFSSYGHVVEHQIMMDRETGRSRGFGFVTFDAEDAVEKIFFDGQMHELGGKKVEIKRAEPKRAGFDHPTRNQPRQGSYGGRMHDVGNSKSYDNFSSGPEGFTGGYGGKMGGRGGYGGNYGGYGGYGNFAGNHTGGTAGFYPGYGGYGYGYGYGGPMYGGGGFGAYGGAPGYGVGKGYGGSAKDGFDGGPAGYGVGKGYGGSVDDGFDGGKVVSSGGGESYGPGRGYGDGKGYGNGRFHPYRK